MKSLWSFKSLGSILTFNSTDEAIKSILTPSRKTISFFFILFPSVISEDLYFDMLGIEDCSLDRNLPEITPI